MYIRGYTGKDYKIKLWCVHSQYRGAAAIDDDADDDGDEDDDYDYEVDEVDVSSAHTRRSK